MFTKKTIILISLASLIFTMFLFRNHHGWTQVNASQEQAAATTGSLSGLRNQVAVVRDRYGVPHITASNDHDAYFMMGYLHAQDRFFQMDVARRRGRGTLAELLGAGPGDSILGGDFFQRTIGIGRSAERSLSVSSPETLAILQAYSDGVNVWLNGNSLPPEYRMLEITQVPRWSPVDSITIFKLISFQANDRTDLARTENLSRFQMAGQAKGFDGTKLFFEDIFTFAPFAAAVTIPYSEDAAPQTSQQARSLNLQSQMMEQARHLHEMISPGVMEAARKFLKQAEYDPLSNLAEAGIGSNWWVVSGSKTNTGNAMIANDPHLALGTPSTFYEIHLTVNRRSSPMNVYGVSYSGVPGVVLGQNERISWGATISALDVTDLFAESLVTENGVPVATRYKGGTEPVVAIPEVFRINQIQNNVGNDVIVVGPGARPSGLNLPPATLIVPRRNNGPLIPGSPTSGLSMQFTGASGTREVEGILSLARARNLNDFKRGLQYLDVGALNWAYADVDGNIATFVSGKVPLREDLQAGTIDGLPPFFIRDGTGSARNEWIPTGDSGPGFNYESLPFEEMPQSINPAQGFLVNANNDPLGITLDNDPINQTRREGIYYISYGFDAGFRAAKITSLLNQRLNDQVSGKISFHDMQRIQSNVQMFDAEVFTPYIIRAFDAARRAGAPGELAALANDPAVSEAVGRLSDWDFSAPTGIAEGYDASDINGVRRWPSQREVSNSVAATIYNVWRSQILANTITATLQRAGLENIAPAGDRMLVSLRLLLDNFSTRQGVGSSGLDFFEIPEVQAPPEVRRDRIILKSLKDALDLIADDAFAPAFGNSTNQNDYLWGKLHRVTFNHPFGSFAPQFSIPTAGNFVDLSPTLPGLATDGGYQTIDNSTFNANAASFNDFRYESGSIRRYVGELDRCGIKSVQILPGGESGVAGNRFYANQLSLWLTNDYHRVLYTNAEIHSQRYERIIFNPSK